MKPIVTKIGQTTITAPNGALANGYAVTFMVGTQGPFTLQILATEFTAAEVNKRTAAFAAELAQIPMQGT